MEKNKFIELENLGNKRPFALPENYFDDFAAQMEKTVAEMSVSEQPQQRIKPWMYGVAASIIGAIFMVQIFISENKKKETLISETYETYVLSQVSENSIIDYYLTSENE
ncbi:MAG TPA: hypothetical protein GXZ87_04610 [Bacteroidales bacterium]|nr:hypothetical protein [Bacteroidales bacterium]